LHAESFCTDKLLHTEAFRHRCVYTENLLHRSFYTWDAFTQRSFSTQKAFTHSTQRPLYAQNGNRMHKILTCTSLSYKTCANFFPVLHCTTSLAQSTVLLCTTNGCTKHFPVLLCTTKLARSLACTTLIVLQDLHKGISSPTLYYKAFTKHSLVLLCTTKLDKTLPSTTLSTQTRCPLSYTKKTSSPTHVPCDMHAAIKTRPNYTRLGYTRPHTTQD